MLDTGGRHNRLTGAIIGACFEVANELGRGFLESVYESALMIALSERGLKARRQVPLEVYFRGVSVGSFYADLLVEECVIVELKAATALTSDHKAQLINYLKATGIDVGLLVNFGAQRLEHRRLWRPSDDAEISGHSQDV